jgi:hypothetical protein
MTYGPVKANCQITTVSIAASGTTVVAPLASQQCYAKVGITVVPLGDGPDYTHKVILYFNGVEKETKEYTDPDELNISEFTYEKLVYPPTSWGTQPGLNGLDPGITGFTVSIENTESATREFLIYSTCELYEVASYTFSAK